jgi:hypothetical protein
METGPLGHRGFESHPLRRAYNFQSIFAGLNCLVVCPNRMRACDWRDFHARDRSVTAGRTCAEGEFLLYECHPQSYPVIRDGVGSIYFPSSLD